MLFVVLMLFIGGAFLLQIFFGYFQVKHLSRVFVQMRRKGRVAIGRKKGHFRSGTIVFLAVDQEGSILDAKRMQGVTIFARFKTLSSLIGENIVKINPLKLSGYNKLLRLSISDAVNNYCIVARGGTIETQRNGTPLGTALIGIRALFMGKFRSKNQKG